MAAARSALVRLRAPAQHRAAVAAPRIIRPLPRSGPGLGCINGATRDGLYDGQSLQGPWEILAILGWQAAADRVGP